MRKSKKIDYGAIAAAVVVPGAFNLAMEGAAKKIDFVSENYLLVRSGAAGVLGAGLVYFGNSEPMKAAGYGLLGLTGASLASKATAMFGSENDEQASGSDDTPVQGTRKMQRILSGKTFANRRRKMQHVDMNTKELPGGGMPHAKALPSSGMMYEKTLASLIDPIYAGIYS